MTTPGTLFLIDTSALARLDVKPVREIIMGALDDGVAATCGTIDLEAGFSARNATSLATTMNVRRELYQTLETDERCFERARRVMLMMAGKGLHRAAGPMDLITAAVAELNFAVVLHYDADFEHIASVTGQRQAWVVPRGSID